MLTGMLKQGGFLQGEETRMVPRDRLQPVDCDRAIKGGWVRTGRAGLVAMLLLAMLWLPGCNPEQKKTYIKDGREYGTVNGAFRHRWWNYYERAISLAEGEFLLEALADLDEAIRQRDHDQRMARTYGMHFVDYFPHRERGIVYFKKGMLEEARMDLEASLAMTTSAKAQHYLDRVRKQWIEQHNLDSRLPEVEIAFPRKAALVNGFTLAVSGTARDDSFVKEITVNGIAARIDLSAPVIPFEVDIPLDYQTDTLVVTVTDLVGNVNVARQTITIDRTGPVVGIDSVVATPGPTGTTIQLTGKLTDASGIATLKVNDRLLPIRPEKLIELDHTFTLSKDVHHFTIQVTDLAGNITTADIGADGKLQAAQSKLLAANDALCNYPGALLLAAALGDGPYIELKKWQDGQQVYLEKLYLEIKIESEKPVSKVRVNNRPILNKSGRQIFFGHLVALAEGKNSITIEVTDSSGRVSQKKLSLQRLKRSADSVDARLKVAVLPFKHKGGENSATDTVEDNLHGFITEHKRFDLVEREHMDNILAEQKLSASDLVDPQTALNLGKLVAATNILSGSIALHKNSVEIFARLIDTETSLVLAATDVFGEDTGVLGIKALCEGLSVKLTEAVPLVEGHVVKAKGAKVLVDLGESQGIKPGMQLVLFKLPEDIDFDDTEILGQARITKVKQKTSVAELVKEKTPGSIPVMTQVVTR